MIDKPPRIALLIDADNSPAAKIGLILNELSTFGETSIRRAYGNWKKQELRGWEEILHDHAIRPMQQFDYSKGKNASDMAMVIDALDLLYSDRPEAFGIVSSDADFTPLVMYLRAKGAAVYGLGGTRGRRRNAAAGAGRQAQARCQARRAPAQRRRGGGGRERLGPRRRGRPADRQPGVLRLAQLRLRDADQAAQGDRSLPARQG